MLFWSYIRCFPKVEYQLFKWFTFVRGVGSSCPGWFILPPTLPPALDLGQTVSSVNSYCTIILEYLVVRDVNTISAKLSCLHPTFSLVTLVRGAGSKLSRLVYLAPPPQKIWVISWFVLHHDLGIHVFSCKRCVHYFSQTKMLTSNVQFCYPCPRGGGQAVQASLSCPPPRIRVRQCHHVILNASLSWTI